MPEWLVEEGIGEHRAILIERGEIIGARVDWLETVRPGLVTPARLVSKPRGANRALGRLDDGSEVLVDRLPASVSEGKTILLEITRAAIAERGRNKLAQSRPAPEGAVPRNGPSLIDGLKAGEFHVTRCRPADGAFNDIGWDELVEEALSGAAAFASGSLVIDATPAMTVVDIDGNLPPLGLALAAIPALVQSMRRLDIAGSVAIDFPSIESRKDRQAVDSALAEALKDWRGERTAMNGFGLVQLVSRLERPSILARYQQARGRLGMVTLARRAESAPGHGALLMCAHPALRQHIPSDFESAVTARTGRRLKWDWSESVALEAPYVQSLSE
ncbi:MAG: ribonuclease E/G [Novosphingobium sp.]